MLPSHDIMDDHCSDPWLPNSRLNILNEDEDSKQTNARSSKKTEKKSDSDLKDHKFTSVPLSKYGTITMTRADAFPLAFEDAEEEHDRYLSVYFASALGDVVKPLRSILRAFKTIERVVPQLELLEERIPKFAATNRFRQQLMVTTRTILENWPMIMDAHSLTNLLGLLENKAHLLDVRNQPWVGMKFHRGKAIDNAKVTQEFFASKVELLKMAHQDIVHASATLRAILTGQQPPDEPYDWFKVIMGATTSLMTRFLDYLYPTSAADNVSKESTINGANIPNSMPRNEFGPTTPQNDTPRVLSLMTFQREQLKSVLGKSSRDEDGNAGFNFRRPPSELLAHYQELLADPVLQKYYSAQNDIALLEAKMLEIIDPCQQAAVEVKNANAHVVTEVPETPEEDQPRKKGSDGSSLLSEDDIKSIEQCVDTLNAFALGQGDDFHAFVHQLKVFEKAAQKDLFYSKGKRLNLGFTHQVDEELLLACWSDRQMRDKYVDRIANSQGFKTLQQQREICRRAIVEAARASAELPSPTDLKSSNRNGNNQKTRNDIKRMTKHIEELFSQNFGVEISLQYSGGKNQK